MRCASLLETVTEKSAPACAAASQPHEKNEARNREIHLFGYVEKGTQGMTEDAIGECFEYVEDLRANGHFAGVIGVPINQPRTHMAIGTVNGGSLRRNLSIEIAFNSCGVMQRGQLRATGIPSPNALPPYWIEPGFAALSISLGEMFLTRVALSSSSYNEFRKSSMNSIAVIFSQALAFEIMNGTVSYVSESM